jgi:hypothetical protein
MDKQNSNNSYEVKDLSVAAFLYSLDTVLFSGKKRLPDGTVVFLFSPYALVNSLISQYWTLKAPHIQPKQLFSAQRDLKDMIFGG